MVIAQVKHLSGSYRKVQPVLSLVRGRTVADALVILDHTPRKARHPVIKLLESAQANARANHNYRPDNLVIREIFVTNGSRLRRYRLSQRQRQGRRWPVPYQRRTCHLRIVLDGQLRSKTTRPPAQTMAKKAVQTAAKGGKDGSES